MKYLCISSLFLLGCLSKNVCFPRFFQSISPTCLCSSHLHFCHLHSDHPLTFNFRAETRGAVFSRQPVSWGDCPHGPQVRRGCAVCPRATIQVAQRTRDPGRGAELGHGLAEGHQLHEPRILPYLSHGTAVSSFANLVLASMEPGASLVTQW